MNLPLCQKFKTEFFCSFLNVLQCELGLFRKWVFSICKIQVWTGFFQNQFYCVPSCESGIFETGYIVCHTCESGVLKPSSMLHVWSGYFGNGFPFTLRGERRIESERERERESGVVCVLRSGDGEPYPLWVAGFVSASAFYPLQFAFTFRI